MSAFQNRHDVTLIQSTPLRRNACTCWPVPCLFLKLARERNLLENASWPTALALVLLVVAIVFGVVIWSIRRHRDPTLEIACDAPIEELLPSIAGLTRGRSFGATTSNYRQRPGWCRQEAVERRGGTWGCGESAKGTVQVALGSLHALTQRARQVQGKDTRFGRRVAWGCRSCRGNVTRAVCACAHSMAHAPLPQMPDRAELGSIGTSRDASSLSLARPSLALFARTATMGRPCIGPPGNACRGCRRR